MTHRVLSSDPISPFMEGSGSDLDDEGRGSLILSSATASLWLAPWFEVPIIFCMEKLVWLVFRFLGPWLGVSLWWESGVSAPSPLSIQLDSEEERSRTFL